MVVATYFCIKSVILNWLLKIDAYKVKDVYHVANGNLIVKISHQEYLIELMSKETNYEIRTDRKCPKLDSILTSSFQLHIFLFF